MTRRGGGALTAFTESDSEPASDEGLGLGLFPLERNYRSLASLSSLQRFTAPPFALKVRCTYPPSEPPFHSHLHLTSLSLHRLACTQAQAPCSASAPPDCEFERPYVPLP